MQLGGCVAGAQCGGTAASLGRCYAATVTQEQPDGYPQTVKSADPPAPTPDSAAAPDPSSAPGANAAPAREGLVDLFGLLAYAELVAFFRLSEDASLAPSLEDKAALGGMAVAEFSHFERIRAELERLGSSPVEAMQPFTAPLDAFHVRTAPADWLESLVKAYVGDGFAADFYRAVAEVLDPDSRALVLDVLADTGHAQFAVEHVRAAIAADPKVAGRLALWARRLVGEALGEAQRVAALRPALANLLVGGMAPGGDLGEIGRMFARLTDAHVQRMNELGLAD